MCGLDALVIAVVVVVVAAAVVMVVVVARPSCLANLCSTY
jgi:hypothetical protein